MSVTVNCKKCGYVVYAPRSSRGKKVRCPGCTHSLVVPEGLLPTDPPVTMACPQCASSLQVTRQLAGKKVRCNKCKIALSILTDLLRVIAVKNKPASSSNERPAKPASTRTTIPKTFTVTGEQTLNQSATAQSHTNTSPSVTPPPVPPVVDTLNEPIIPPRVGSPPQAPQTESTSTSGSRTSPSSSPPAEMPRHNLYRVLNVSQTASLDELKKAINKELRLWSNRTNAPQIERRQEAERMVKLLEQAEAILLEPSQRAAYDQYLMSSSAEQRGVHEGDLSGQIDLVQEARRLLIEGDIPDALYIAEKATQSDGNNAEAWATLAEARFRWGSIEDAIYEYKRAIKLRPNEATYYFDFGCVLESAGRPADALQQYMRAAQIDPSTTMYRAAVGSLLVKEAQYVEGIEVLEQCRREQPDNPTYQWFLAIAYDASSTLGWTYIGQDHPLLEEGWYATEFKHITDAQDCINKALSLKFDDPKLMAALQDHRKLIDEMLQRKLMCNWAVAIIVGLIGIPLFFIPTVLAILYVISSSTPQYRINKQLVEGKRFNEFAFIADTFGGGNIGCLGVLFVYAFIIVAMPFVVAINFYRNWLGVPTVKRIPTS